MKIGRWRYTSLEGQREAIVVADDKNSAYNSLPLALYPRSFELIEWIGETSDPEQIRKQVINDTPINTTLELI